MEKYKLIDQIDEIEQMDKQYNEKIVDFEWFDNNDKYKIVNNDDPITNCLIHTFYFNIFKNIVNTDYYVSLYQPDFTNIYQIKKINKFMDETLLKNNNKPSYVITISKNDKKLTLIHGINHKLISKILPHIFNTQTLNYEIDENIIKNELLKQYQLLSSKTIELNDKYYIDLYDTTDKYIKTINEMKREMVS